MYKRQAGHRLVWAGHASDCALPVSLCHPAGRIARAAGLAGGAALTDCAGHLVVGGLVARATCHHVTGHVVAGPDLPADVSAASVHAIEAAFGIANDENIS